MLRTGPSPGTLRAGSSHACNICGREFNRLDNLRKHELIHTGQKPYSCPHCPYRAVLKGNVTKHIQARHAEFLPPPDVAAAAAAGTDWTKHGWNNFIDVTSIPSDNGSKEFS